MFIVIEVSSKNINTSSSFNTAYGYQLLLTMRYY